MSEKQCEDCEGTGRAWINDDCENCDNAGWVLDEEYGGTMTCPDCDGESDEDCDACEGYGTLE